MTVDQAPRDPMQEAKRRGFEPRDVPAPGVALAVLGILVSIGLAAAFVAAVLAWFPESLSQATPLETIREAPPKPRLEVSPRASGAAVQAAARARLEGYAWTDREAGRARIPIERAMKLLTGHGWPDAPENGADQR
ncbi:MAG: hypothetical protein KJZ80_15750 [Hyphomicrobiaceae bacterium]|nr:hypothetical protein [Hyphomicrobiaceae bacterium]